MALSKYERKVLAEFEADFAAPTRRRWRRVLAAITTARHRLWRLQGRVRPALAPASAILLALAGCALCIAYARPQAAPYLTAAIAAAGGALTVVTWPRRR